MGHSFGGRLVAFTLAGLGDKAGPASPVKSLLLIQAAFSHFAFAQKIPLFGASPNGKLANCRDRVDGPLMCTFSPADLAVGRWYPAASMINGSDAESAIDLTYRWGAMGHDGYQPGPDAVTVDIKAAGDSYAFEAGTFHRIASGTVIKAMQSTFSGAHSDIRHDEVVWPAVDAAMAAAKRGS
jgi:hypothetical protein